MDGRDVRLARVLSLAGRALVVPIDQALSSGPMPGLIDSPRTVETIAGAGPSAMIMHRGAARASWPPRSRAALIVHLSGGTELSGAAERKAPVCTVEDALRLGADAVSVHISLGAGEDSDALRHLAQTVSSASPWSLPVLAMMYVYGDVARKPGAGAQAARIGAELGADLVKVSCPDELRELERLVDGCYVPVLVAGGPPGENGWPLLQTIEEAMKLGAAGACVGRNVYQHPDPAAMVRALKSVIHDGSSAREAYDENVGFPAAPATPQPA